MPVSVHDEGRHRPEGRSPRHSLRLRLRNRAWWRAEILHLRSIDTPEIVITTSYGEFSVSCQTVVRLRGMGQPEALEENDGGRYSSEAEVFQEPILNRRRKSIPRDDDQLAHVFAKMWEEANGHCATLKVVEISGGTKWTASSTSVKSIASGSQFGGLR